jgi:glycerol-3-phosphate dehydrogenase subunit B
MPTFDFRRDAYATDLAGWLETTPLDRLVSAWRAVVSGVGRLGLPAVLGLRQHERVRKELEAGLGVSLFEIPTLPPSVPGLRLELALRSAAMELGVRMIEGARAAARVERNSGSLRCSSVTAEGPSGLRPHAAEAVLLATGGPLHGGWQAPRRGVPRESVFGIPLDPPLPQEQWTSPSYFAPQPYMRLGLRVDQDLRPLGENGDPLAENVFAAGGILAGADRRAEGSREGIDLATAYMAVAKALA